MSYRMMKGLAAGAALLFWPAVVAAQTTMQMTPAQMQTHMMAMHMPPELSVSASGSVDYVPDNARITLGIRADSPSAAAAVDTINKNAAAVIAAIKGAGISESAIKTIGYTLFYRERQNPPLPAAVNSGSAVPAAAAASGVYEASEILAVTAPVGAGGKVLDAAIAAGANESFGIDYQTTKYDALYREALAKAIKSARDTADAIARAARVSIVEIQSISNTAQSTGAMGPTLARPMSAASVLPGTDTVTATVYVVYRIK